jgi:hypothetical protein
VSKFSIGDLVIIRKSIGMTNEVAKIDKIEGVDYGNSELQILYCLSNGEKYFADKIELWNPNKDLEGEYVQKLKLEVGKKYLTRNGKIAKITGIRDSLYCFSGYAIDEGLNNTWTKDGRILVDRNKDFDLIEEVTEELKMKIDMNKKYRTRDGRSVEIISVRVGFKYGVIGVIKGNSIYSTWTLYGKTWVSEDNCQKDLIEVIPYEDFKIDDKVLVRNDDELMWNKRHYAKFEDDYYWCYDSGYTSYTASKCITEWKQCIKFEDYTPDMGEIVE